MLEAVGGFRYSWEGRSEVLGRVGVLWLVGRRNILPVDKTGGSREEAHAVAISIDGLYFLDGCVQDGGVEKEEGRAWGICS